MIKKRRKIASLDYLCIKNNCYLNKGVGYSPELTND